MAVPVVEDILKPNANGTGSMDPEAMTAEGFRIGGDPEVEWNVEEVRTEIQP